MLSDKVEFLVEEVKLAAGRIKLEQELRVLWLGVSVSFFV